MSDPRASVGYDRIGQETITLKIDNSTITYSATADGGSSQVGLAVTLSAADTVELVGDGEAVLGKLLSVESDNFATVQIGGFMTLPGGASASLTLGKAIVGDLDGTSAEGYIREVNTATAGELGLCHGKIYNASDPTAVWVKL
jgi:hypothetical protein